MTGGDSDPRSKLERLARLFERARVLEIERAPVALDLARRAPVVDLCGALVRQRWLPALAGPESGPEPDVGSRAAGGPAAAHSIAAALERWLDRDPLHVSVFGSTNTGKSTVLNVLLGRAASGMRVTARYSQHPEAWAAPEVIERALAFPSRFPGYARYRDEPAPRQSDAELVARGWRPALATRDPARIPAGARSVAEPDDAAVDAADDAPQATPDAVLWDAPDVSTEEAQAWLAAILDTLALTEVALYVVTHESYADERGLVLFELASAMTASVDVCANKVASGSAIAADIRTKLARGEDRARGADDSSLAIHPLPWVDGDDAEERLERLLASPEAERLRAAVAERIADARTSKLAGLERSLRFVAEHFDAALAPLVAEARVADRWSAVCRKASARELDTAYVEAYLESRRYQDFRDALLELMRLLEVPGVGPLLKGLGRVARLPVGLARKAWFSATRRPDAAALAPGESEHAILARLFRSWLAALKAEAQALARAEGHPAWGLIAAEVESDRVVEDLVAGFERGYRAYREEVRARVAESARAIHAKLAENPKLLAGLRTANLVGDAGVTLSAVAAGGLSPTDWLVGPLVHALWEELVERGLGSFVRQKEDELKRWQAERARQLFATELEARARALFVGALDLSELERGRADLLELTRATEAASAAIRTANHGGAR